MNRRDEKNALFCAAFTIYASEAVLPVAFRLNQMALDPAKAIKSRVTRSLIILRTSRESLETAFKDYPSPP